MELASSVAALVAADRSTAPAAAGSWGSADMEAPPAAMGNPAEVGVAVVDTVVVDMVVVAIHSMAFGVLVAVGCPAVDARSSLFLSRA